MQDTVGIALLFATAFLFRLCFHSTIGLTFSRHDVLRLLPFSVITFWVLLMIAGLWLFALGFTYLARPH
jgi:hypothetical protein